MQNKELKYFQSFRDVCKVINYSKSIAETLGGQIVVILDMSSDTRVQYPEEAKREGIVSVLSVPISVKGQIIGVLRIYTSDQKIFRMMNTS